MLSAVPPTPMRTPSDAYTCPQAPNAPLRPTVRASLFVTPAKLDSRAAPIYTPASPLLNHARERLEPHPSDAPTLPFPRRRLFCDAPENVIAFEDTPFLTIASGSTASSLPTFASASAAASSWDDESDSTLTDEAEVNVLLTPRKQRAHPRCSTPSRPSRTTLPTSPATPSPRVSCCPCSPSRRRRANATPFLLTACSLNTSVTRPRLPRSPAFAPGKRSLAGVLESGPMKRSPTFAPGRKSLAALADETEAEGLGSPIALRRSPLSNTYIPSESKMSLPSLVSHRSLDASVNTSFASPPATPELEHDADWALGSPASFQLATPMYAEERDAFGVNVACDGGEGKMRRTYSHLRDAIMAGRA